MCRSSSRRKSVCIDIVQCCVFVYVPVSACLRCAVTKQPHTASSGTCVRNRKRFFAYLCHWRAVPFKRKGTDTNIAAKDVELARARRYFNVNFTLGSVSTLCVRMHTLTCTPFLPPIGVEFRARHAFNPANIDKYDAVYIVLFCWHHVAHQRQRLRQMGGRSTHVQHITSTWFEGLGRI